MDLEEMRGRFNEELQSIISSKRVDNKAFLSAEEYMARIEEVKQSKLVLRTPNIKKSPKHYRMVRKYDVLTVKNQEKLIRPLVGNSNVVLYYVTNEEMFDILHGMHLSLNHGGRNKMVENVKQKYCNITYESVMAYLRLCDRCSDKFHQKDPAKKRLLGAAGSAKPAATCARIELIDMDQSRAHDDFRFVLLYQDVPTKFLILKPLKTRRTKEVAVSLLEIYTILGAPAVLKSANESEEFVKSVLDELHKMWNEIRVIFEENDMLTMENVQESISEEIKEMVIVWMTENNSKNWPSGLKFVQFRKNQALDSGLGKSPYEAMFGYPARVGLMSNDVALHESVDIKTEMVIEVDPLELDDSDQEIGDEQF